MSSRQRKKYKRSNSPIRETTAAKKTIISAPQVTSNIFGKLYQRVTTWFKDKSTNDSISTFDTTDTSSDEDLQEPSAKRRRVINYTYDTCSVASQCDLISSNYIPLKAQTDISRLQRNTETEYNEWYNQNTWSKRKRCVREPLFIKDSAPRFSETKHTRRDYLQHKNMPLSKTVTELFPNLSKIMENSGILPVTPIKTTKGNLASVIPVDERVMLNPCNSELTSSKMKVSNAREFSIQNINNVNDKKSCSKTEIKTDKRKDITTTTEVDKGKSVMEIPVEPVSCTAIDGEIDKKSLPNLTFDNTPTSTSPVEKTENVAMRNSPNYSSEILSKDFSFTFSKPPLATNLKSDDKPSSSTLVVKFNFYTFVDEVKEPMTASETDSCSILKVNEDETSPILKSTNWKCSECWINNKMEIDKCVCCGEMKKTGVEISNAQIKAVSVPEEESMQTEPISVPEKESAQTKPISVHENQITQTKPVTNWKCSECWINNTMEIDKCVCCGEMKKTGIEISNAQTKAVSVPEEESTQTEPISVPEEESAQTKPISVHEDQITQTKPITNWKCSECWINNTMEIDKCVCCGEMKKTGVEISGRFTSKVSGSSLNSDKRDMNKTNLEKGAVCGSIKSVSAFGVRTAQTKALSVPEEESAQMKPISVREEESAQTKPISVHEDQITQTKPITNWKCSECWINNKMEIDKCVCCGEMKKTGVEISGRFTSKVSDSSLNSYNRDMNKTDVEKGAVCGSIKSVSAFGVQTAPTKAVPVPEEENAQTKPISVSEEESTQTKPISVHEDQITQTKPVTNWKCSECWINNKMEIDKCVCCGEMKKTGVEISNAQMKAVSVHEEESLQTESISVPKEESAQMKPISVPEEVNSRTKPIAVHEERITKTKAASEPDDQIFASDVLTTLSQIPLSFSDSVDLIERILMAKKGLWKCVICLIQNSKDRATCVCCHSLKPVIKKTSEIKPKQLDVLSNLKIRFGVDFNKREAKSEIKNTPEMNIETEKNDVFHDTQPDQEFPKKTTKSFTFGIPPKKPDHKIDEETTHPLKFGISPEQPNQVLIKETKAFTFGIPPEKHESAKETSTEKPFLFGISPKQPDQGSAKETTHTFTFGIPPKQPDQGLAEEKTQSFTFGIPPKKRDIESTTHPFTLGIPSKQPNEGLATETKQPFVFGIPPKKHDQGFIKETISLETQVPENNFSFGVSNEKVVPLPTLPTSKDNDSSTNVEKEEPQKDSEYSLKQTPISVAAPIVFKFVPKTEAKTPIHNSPSTLSQISNAMTNATVVQQPPFTFQPSLEKSTINIFTTPTSTAPTILTPMLNTNTNVQPTVSLFPNSEPKANMFQQSKSVPNVPFSASPTSNIFSFVAPSGVKERKEPQFKFTFGSNNYNTMFDQSANDNKNIKNNIAESMNGIQTVDLFNNPPMFATPAQNTNSWSDMFMPNTGFPSTSSGGARQNNTGANFTFGKDQQVPTPFVNNVPYSFTGSPVTNAFGAPMTQSCNIFNPDKQLVNQGQEMCRSAFGTSNVPPTFGIPSAPPVFSPSTLAPPSTFNFGAPMNTGVFDFGQKSTPFQEDAQPRGTWNNLGGMPANPTPVQFTMGTSMHKSSTARRIKKAVRRTNR